jgi:hypothetical protein
VRGHTENQDGYRVQAADLIHQLVRRLPIKPLYLLTTGYFVFYLMMFIEIEKGQREWVLTRMLDIACTLCNFSPEAVCQTAKVEQSVYMH